MALGQLRKILLGFTLSMSLVASVFSQTEDQAEGGLVQISQITKQLAKQLVDSADVSNKITVAILPFPNADGTCSILSNIVANSLMQSLFLVKNSKFKVVERLQLDPLFDELKRSEGGWLNPDTMKRLGTQSGVGALALGEIDVFGDILQISARVMATDTFEAVSVATVSVPKVSAVDDLLKRPVTTGPTCTPHKVGNNFEPRPTCGQSLAETCGGTSQVGKFENDFFSIKEIETFSYMSEFVAADYNFHAKRDFAMMLPYQGWLSGSDDKGNEYQDGSGDPPIPVCNLQSNKCKEGQFKKFTANMDMKLFGALRIKDPKKWGLNKPQFIEISFNFLVRDGEENVIIEVPIKSEMEQTIGAANRLPNGCGVLYVFGGGLSRLACQSTR